MTCEFYCIDLKFIFTVASKKARLFYFLDFFKITLLKLNYTVFIK